MQTPHESFHNMQDCWKKEIAEVLHELRLKEKVSEFRWTLIAPFKAIDILVINLSGKLH